MKTKFFAINFICAAALFFAAHVQADYIAPKWPGQGNEFVKLDSYFVSYKDGALNATGGNLQRNPGADIINGRWDDYMGWSYSVTAPKDYDFFVIDLITDVFTHGPIDLNINGENPFELYGYGQPGTYDPLYFTWVHISAVHRLGDGFNYLFDNTADANGLLVLDFLTYTYDEMEEYRFLTPNFNLTFYREVPIGGGQAPTPEPATLAVLGLGLAGLGLVNRRRRK